MAKKFNHGRTQPSVHKNDMDVSVEKALAAFGLS